MAAGGKVNGYPKSNNSVTSIYISGPLTGPLSWAPLPSQSGLNWGVNTEFFAEFAEPNDFPDFIVEDGKARPFDRNKDIVWSK